MKIFTSLKNLQYSPLRMLKDFASHILAFALYTAARQLMAFPLLANHLSADVYGTLLTIIGLTSVCTALIGGSLNNIRLIRDADYHKLGKKGDFQLLCAIGAAISAAFSLIIGLIFRLHWLTTLLLTAYILVCNYFQYATAFFRLTLDFKRNLIAYSISAISYAFASLFCGSPLLWPIIFLVGDGAGLLYTALVTKFHREPFSTTPLFGTTTKEFVNFMLTNLVGNVLVYADRFIVFAALSAASVSYYSAAAFFGKTASLIMTPISSVLLGYFSQKSFKPSKRLFVLVNSVSLGCMVIFLLASHFMAPWTTNLLYPSLFENAAPYIPLASLSAAIGIAASLTQPMILKGCSVRWLLLIQLIYGPLYVLLAIWLLPLHGLYGFCWAAIISGVVRVLALYILGFTKLP